MSKNGIQKQIISLRNIQSTLCDNNTASRTRTVTNLSAFLSIHITPSKWEVSVHYIFFAKIAITTAIIGAFSDF